MLHEDALINQRYRVKQVVGRGGMGDVYAAFDEQLGRAVALKVLKPAFAADPHDRERFLREAQIAAQIIHPNVVRTYDIGEADEGPFLVQELLEGRTLEEAIPLTPQHALAVALAVADALDYIHARGYVHCDVKPQNIMLLPQDDQERIVLLDFGIARAQDADTTSLIATPYYLAPEQARGDTPTAASDLYAFGIVLYHMLTGKLPFDAPAVEQIINGHLYEPLPALDIADPHVFEIEAVVLKLTAKQPADRYASAADVRADLCNVLEGMRHTKSRRLPRSLLPRIFRRRARAAVLPSLAFCVVLGAAWTRTPATDQSVALQATRLVGTQSTPGTLSIPNVLGLPIDRAQQLIEAAGLAFIVGESVPSNRPVGTVVGTTPGADQWLAPGATVTVQISAGPTSFPLPSLTFPPQPEAPPAIVAADSTPIKAVDLTSAVKTVPSQPVSAFVPVVAPESSVIDVVAPATSQRETGVPPVSGASENKGKQDRVKNDAQKAVRAAIEKSQQLPVQKPKEVKEPKQAKQQTPASPPKASPPKQDKKQSGKSEKEPKQNKPDKGKAPKSGKNR